MVSSGAFHRGVWDGTAQPHLRHHYWAIDLIMYKGPLDVQSLSAPPLSDSFFVPLFSFFFSTPAPLPSQEEEAGEIMLIFPPCERLSHPSGERKKPIPGSKGKEEQGEKIMKRPWERFWGKAGEESTAQVITAAENRRDSPLLTQWEEGRAGDKCSGASSQRQQNLRFHTSACFCRARRKQQSQQTLTWASVSQPLVKEAKGGAQSDDARAWLVFEPLQIRHKITINA